MTANVKFAALS